MPLRRLPALGTLRAFEAAARLSSFKEAARELSVTPGAISQHIRALEEDLGIKLFNRAVRSVTLTNEGRQLQPVLTLSFMKIRDAIDKIRPHELSSLTLEASGPTINKWLLPIIPKFTQSFPDVSISIQSNNAISELGDTGPDVALRFTKDPGPGLYSQKIFDEYVLPLASPDLIKSLDVKEPSDLVRCPLLHDSSCEVFQSPVDWPTWFAHAGLNPTDARHGMRFDPHAADQAIEAAINGAGVVLGRHALAYHDLMNERLVCPFGPILKMHVSYYVVCRQGDENKPEIADLIHWIGNESTILHDHFRYVDVVK